MNYRQLVSCILVIVLLSACGGGGSNTPSDTQPPSQNGGNSDAPISLSASYTYQITADVKYAEGLTHSDWNAPDPVSMDLLLDVYEPDNDLTGRPAVIFIHGGGFISGNKNAGFNFMSFFAERGFVGFSINYRLLSDYGTLPEEVVQVMDNLPGLNEQQRNQGKAFYPAGRDAKAAVRWVYANADQYNIDTSSISVIGGSAGSYISMALGVTEPEDYTDELSITEDPTLSTTNLTANPIVHTIIDHWGGAGLIDLIDYTYGLDRFDASDAPVSIVHGTVDTTVTFDEAIYIRDRYLETGVQHAFYPLEGIGHSAWNATVNGMSLHELALDFIVRSQGLEIRN